ncbi:MAG TPA: hypothetical protein VFE46_11720 [Pirellulales bacterium]|jgi:hypothetical protein|nr:hypothetical protein [Pirellulales bacterium]
MAELPTIDDETFRKQFEDCVFPADQWHHREHVKIAYLYLQHYPLSEAVEQMRTALKRYNAAQQVPDALDRGYHERLTLAWMRLVHFTLCEYGPADNADAFYQQHPQLWQMKVLRLFYSRERIMSWEAKKNFLPPDITKLPEPKSSQSSC